MAYIIGIILIVVVAVGFALSRPKDTTTEPVVTTTENSEPAVESADIVSTDSMENETKEISIADGTHETTVFYSTPAKDEYRLDVSLTTEDGVITDANIVYSQGAEEDPNPQRFDKAYKEVVIGQELEGLELSRVGGASLTTTAFNEALTKIATGNG